MPWLPARSSMTVAVVVLATGLAALVSGCSSGGVDAPPTATVPTGPSETPGYRWPLHATVRLTPAGPEPPSITINVGGRVTFVNADERPHEIVSDPYLRHEECPPINRVGFLVPGAERESAIFEGVRSCGFHDHLDPTGVTGRVEVRIE